MIVVEENLKDFKKWSGSIKKTVVIRTFRNGKLHVKEWEPIHDD